MTTTKVRTETTTSTIKMQNKIFIPVFILALILGQVGAHFLNYYMDGSSTSNPTELRKKPAE